MKTIRVIPRLDIKGPNLVKGVHLEGLRVLGRPSELAKYYVEQGADELIYQDVVASLFGRNSLHDMISQTAKEVSIPICVGGGLRSLDDIKAVLRAGADKVSLNTAAILDPTLIKRASQKFGRSTIVVAIETVRQKDGRYFCFTDNGRETTGVDALEWAEKVEELGAGEILLTSVDRDGTGLGFDSDLVQNVSDRVGIPVMAHGGAASKEGIANCIKSGKADAVVLASILHYEYVARNSNVSEDEVDGNLEFLKSGRTFSRISTSTVPEIKQYLASQEIEVRI